MLAPILVLEPLLHILTHTHVYSQFSPFDFNQWLSCLELTRDFNGKFQGLFAALYTHSVSPAVFASLILISVHIYLYRIHLLLLKAAHNGNTFNCLEHR